MNLFYPPYDFLIIGTATVVLGCLCKETYQEFSKINLRGIYTWVCFAVAYVVVSVTFAFLANDLPLKLYGYSGPSLPSGVSVEGSGPHIGAAFYAGGIMLMSLILNLLLWSGCLIIFAFAGVKKLNVKRAEPLDGIF